jgi:hypothetical protein
MNKRHLILCVATLSLMLALLLSAGTALANPPDRITIPVADSFVLAECDGFDVVDEYTGWATLTYHYDSNGALVRTTLHMNTHDRLYNSVTGFSVFNNFAFNQTVDPSTNEYFIRGLAWNVTVPGYGIVFFDAGLGRFVLVNGVFVELQFSGNYLADQDLLCQAMSQS